MSPIQFVAELERWDSVRVWSHKSAAHTTGNHKVHSNFKLYQVKEEEFYFHGIF